MKNQLRTSTGVVAALLGAGIFTNLDAATVVRVEMAAAAPISTPTFASTTVSPRSNVAAPPVSRTPGFVTTTEPGPTVESTRPGGADEGASTSTTSRAADQPSSPATQSGGGGRGRRTATIAPTPGAAPAAGAKGGMPAPAVVYDDPTALQISAEAGWSNVHLWRGIDLVQFTSYNHLVQGVNLPKADSDIYWLGVTATVKGFGLGLKYVESLDDNLNPFYSPTYRERDSYSELVLTASYTAELVPEWLVGSFGFDFLYYPNGEFWGVDHQGMAYAKFNMPRCRWAQPFVDVFYNIATTDSGNGLAASATPIGGRGSTGADLVEGWGVQFGVAGGDVLAQTGIVSWGFGYSISGIYKRNYAFEDDGLSHLVFGISAPVGIGENFTLTPSVSYVEPLQDISRRGAPGVNPLATAWNEPGWVASVKASWAF